MFSKILFALVFIGCLGVVVDKILPDAVKETLKAWDKEAQAWLDGVRYKPLAENMRQPWVMFTCLFGVGAPLLLFNTQSSSPAFALSLIGASLSISGIVIWWLSRAPSNSIMYQRYLASLFLIAAFSVLLRQIFLTGSKEYGDILVEDTLGWLGTLIIGGISMVTILIAVMPFFLARLAQYLLVAVHWYFTYCVRNNRIALLLFCFVAGSLATLLKAWDSL